MDEYLNGAAYPILSAQLLRGAAAPGLNVGTLDASIFSSSPVFGFPPDRAARSPHFESPETGQ
jgi:hypothetical protein